MNVEGVIGQLGLEPHPEGGYYRQTWKSPETVTLSDGRVRALATLILFYLPAGSSSAWHAVKSDETWIAHTGTVVLEVGGQGAGPTDVVRYRVGTDIDVGEQLQVLVPAGVWQRTVPSDADALVSCLVSPGFEFKDFRLGG